LFCLGLLLCLLLRCSTFIKKFKEIQVCKEKSTSI
jgi:hypothetical protein